MKPTTINFTDMKKNLFKLLSFLVLSTLIISCGEKTNPLIKKGQDGIKAQDYDAAISSLNQAILEDSTNADAYYYRGVAYAEMAEANSNVSARKDSYIKMRESLEMANKLYLAQGAKSLQSVESELLMNRKWGKEHNQGVQYATQDASLSTVDEPFELAEDHFENAITINPDSLISLEVLADVYRINNKPEKSLQAFKELKQKSDRSEAYVYDRIGALYLLEERYDEAKDILMEGIEMYPDSVFLVQKLADTYMNLGNNQESIKVIESLIERDPQNPQYHLVLGTQVYIMASEIDDKVSAEYDKIFELERELRNLNGAEKRATEKKIADSRKEIAQESARSDELTERAINELKLVIELRPEDATTFNSLGIIYQNRASSLFDKRNATTDNDEAARIDTEAKEKLRTAMGYYEKATELEPENQEYWKSLFQVYTLLGMNDKAEAAMEKAGM